MQIQVNTVSNNVNFSGLKLKNSKPVSNKSFVRQSSLEQKMSAIGWGAMIIGLLFSIGMAGKTVLNNISKNDSNKVSEKSDNAADVLKNATDKEAFLLDL